MSLRWRKAATRSSPRRGSSDSDRPWDPEQCVKLLAGNTDLTRLTIVKRELAHASSSWMNRFLELDGLEALFRALDTYSAQTSFQDAVLQLHCVECLRALMNGRTGLDHIVGQPRYTRKLAEGESYAAVDDTLVFQKTGAATLALDTFENLRQRNWLRSVTGTLPAKVKPRDMLFPRYNATSRLANAVATLTA
ncbi:hypothetical protein HPB48_001116 [Haemaphysalis longicornis]|uniref:Formin GTPase-binding domain-containing protein n=1 Tax=Haemaphysalis longicornis TaxID=44386 RepID=A0A9J6GHX7_HAELO|nr:hypothetical protein HPB48_001116 [Haemaphysalis longicornis]